ncbi:hypothetical protein CSUI_005616 [Cystoisospora suis]|uniref:Uncharacterized protein n=1 Tax=Cystoisospora suis TaxID=483139 RepID=A0A2C6KXD2_9APIC|nr:hypothetical protein CSUI_005616 [Cystoisospora suis]
MEALAEGSLEKEETENGDAEGSENALRRGTPTVVSSPQFFQDEPKEVLVSDRALKKSDRSAKQARRSRRGQSRHLFSNSEKLRRVSRAVSVAVSVFSVLLVSIVAIRLKFCSPRRLVSDRAAPSRVRLGGAPRKLAGSGHPPFYLMGPPPLYSATVLAEERGGVALRFAKTFASSHLIFLADVTEHQRGRCLQVCAGGRTVFHERCSAFDAGSAPPLFVKLQRYRSCLTSRLAGACVNTLAT